MTLEEVEIRLTKAVNHRWTNWKHGQCTTTTVTTSDFLLLERTSHESIEDTQGSANVATTQIHSSAGAEVNVPHNLEEPYIRSIERKRRRMWTLEDEDEENTATHTNISPNEETDTESGNDEDIEVESGNEENIEVGNEESEAEIELPRYCTYINKSAIQTKLANAKRRGFKDKAALIKDIEFLIPSVVNDLC